MVVVVVLCLKDLKGGVGEGMGLQHCKCHPNKENLDHDFAQRSINSWYFDAPSGLNFNKETRIQGWLPLHIFVFVDFL